METPETEKEWFVTHEGKQFGPVSIDDLRFEATRGQLNPRLDMVWKKDMDDWIPAGDLKGLFEKNEEAAIVEKAQENPPEPPPRVEVSQKEKEKESRRIRGKWEGTSRGTYLFVTLLLPLLLAGGIILAGNFLEGSLDDKTTFLISGGLILLYCVFALAVTLNRFPNLGMSRWWFLSLFVPPLNIWTNSRLFACPSGYASHRKLDGLGWFLAIIYWLLVLVGLVLAAATAHALSSTSADPDSLKTPGDFLEILRKTYFPE